MIIVHGLMCAGVGIYLVGFDTSCTYSYNVVSMFDYRFLTVTLPQRTHTDLRFISLLDHYQFTYIMLLILLFTLAWHIFILT